MATQTRIKVEVKKETKKALLIEAHGRSTPPGRLSAMATSAK